MNIITVRSIESQSGIRFEGCSAIVSTLHQGVYAEGPLHRGRPANMKRIAFRWLLYADELRACVNHFTNLDGLRLSKFGDAKFREVERTVQDRDCKPRQFPCWRCVAIHTAGR